MEETDRDLEMREPNCSVETANSLDLGFRNPPSLCTLSNAPPSAETSQEKPMEDNVTPLETSDGAIAVTSTSPGQAAMSSDSVVASMELEKNSLIQSSLDSNEVSKNAAEAVCGPPDANSKELHSPVHTTDNNQKAESEDIAPHGDNEREKEDDKGKKRQKKRRKNRKSSKSMTVSQCLGAINKTSADIEFGILDALEVATKVAGEVAKEADSAGESSSSGEEESSDESEQSQENDIHRGSPSKGLSAEEEARVGAGGDEAMDDKNNNSDDDVEENHEAAAVVSETGREKSPCGFDLNQDICCPDETDVIMSVSHSVSSSEKHVICHRGIDLNVAELGEDQAQDLTPSWKHLLPSSSSNSRDGGESSQSHEATNNLRGGSGRFNLDLNCMNDDSDMPPPPPSETRLFLSNNAQQSSSSHVSPFSGKEVSFDLNDRPQFLMDSRDRGPVPYSGISILGAKVDVGRKDSVAQMASFLSNGKSLEPSTGLYMGRSGSSLGLGPGVSFSQAPMYGYNGLSSSSPMYVPGTAIPYMVDSRGSPVMMPQVMGSAQYAQPPTFPQQHLFMRPSFDQGSGFGLEMGNREPLSLRQFLSPEQSGAMGEHSGASGEPSSSSSMSIGGKRKEPETRWEFPPWR